MHHVQLLVVIVRVVYGIGLLGTAIELGYTDEAHPLTPWDVLLCKSPGGYQILRRTSNVYDRQPTASTLPQYRISSSMFLHQTHSLLSDSRLKSFSVNGH